MIKQIRLTNFRGFDEHTVDFGEVSILVGRNNAGKSSLIEAIRIVATLIKQFHSGKFREAPTWVPEPAKGVSSSLADVERKSDAFFHRYSDPPARISALFEGGTKLDIFIGENLDVHAQATSSTGRAAENRATVKEIGFPSIAILPQISPLKDKETVLKQSYVKKCIETHLASRHFRNQLRYMHENFEAFREAFDKTWPGVSLWSFESRDAKWEDPLFLMLREDGFVAEASDFGHGIQMWLQIIWFLSRTDPNSVVVLDEPDVYLHPEQQSAITGLIRGNFQQCILSTHARGILDQCHDPEILRLDRNLPHSAVGTSEEDHRLMCKEVMERATAPPSDKPGRHFDVSVVAYEEATAVLKSEGGETILLVQSDSGKKTISVARQVLRVQVTEPYDIDIYINKTPVPLNDYYHASKAEFRIDLAEYA